MTNKEAIDILVEFNKWRRSETVTALSLTGKNIGEAIDHAIRSLNRMEVDTMDKFVDYVECDQCGEALIENDYCDISGDGHAFCCLQCSLDFYGIRCIRLKKSNETQLNWKQCKESELDEVCMAKRILRETEKNIWRDDENDKAH